MFIIQPDGNTSERNEHQWQKRKMVGQRDKFNANLKVNGTEN
jgi:hypothetical protein